MAALGAAVDARSQGGADGTIEWTKVLQSCMIGLPALGRRLAVSVGRPSDPRSVVRAKREKDQACEDCYCDRQL